MNESAKKLEKIFLAVLELGSIEERQRYLDKVCGEDVTLRQQVEELLKSHESAGSFMLDDADPEATQVLTGVSESVGMEIGPYKLIEQIGEGGMGVVFRAAQSKPVKREVALKVIKPGMDSKAVISRFEAERQALAMMDHPHIAKVLDAGTTDSGRPYFVMELIKGWPITKFCDREQFSLAERLHLFRTVCEAVQHAHQKGIIHRDIKPSNVLVSLANGNPSVKVIDFGVAKALHHKLTENTLWTSLQQVVGTPMYMSPEQADQAGAGYDIDTRTDIYSLGVLLYELMTGSTPFGREDLQKAGLDEIRRIICEHEPVKPSMKISTLGETLPSVAAVRKLEPKRLAAFVRGDLDWIVMKALEKDRERRYATADALADDLERYLEHEPVEAGPPSKIYRFRKFAHRNKGTLVAGLLIVVSLVGGIIGTTWQAIEAAGERDRAVTAEGLAEQRATEAEKAKKEATENFKVALEAVDRMLTRVSEEKLSKIPEMKPIRRQLMNDATEFYERLRTTQVDDTAVRDAMANALLHAGTLNNTLGDIPSAREDLLEAIALLRPKKSDVTLLDESALRLLVRIYEMLAFSSSGSEHLQALEEKLVAARELHRRMSTAVSRKDLAYSHWTLGMGMLYSSEPVSLDDAEKHLREAIHLHVSPWFHMTLGQILRRTGRQDEARQELLRGLELKDSGPQVRRIYNSLGNLENDLGNPDLAIDHYLAAISEYEQNGLVATFNRHDMFNLPRIVANCLKTLESQGRSPEADALAKRIATMYVAVLETPTANDLPQTLHTRLLVDAANLYSTRLENDQVAQRLLRIAIERDPDSTEVAKRAAALCQRLTAMGDAEQALDFARFLADSYRDNDQVAVASGKAYIAFGRYPEARKVVLGDEPDSVDRQTMFSELVYSHVEPKEAVLLFSQLLEESPHSSVYYRFRGIVHREQGNLDAAFVDIDRAVDLLTEDGDPRTYVDRATILARMGRVDEIESDVQRAFEMALGSIDVSHEAALLARWLIARNQPRQAMVIAGLAAKETDYWLVNVALCEAELALDDYDEALGHIEKAIDYAPNESWLYKRKAKAEFRLGQYDEALASLNTSLTKNKDELSALTWISPTEVAICPNEAFRDGIIDLATQAIALTGGDSTAYQARAIHHLAQGNHELALQDLEYIASAEESQSYYSLYQLAMLQLKLDEVEAYRQTCEAMLAAFANSQQPIETNFTAWTCALVPQAISHSERAIEQAQRSVDAEPGNQQYLNSLGAILMRAGHYAEAKEQLQKALLVAGNNNLSPSYAEYFLAMTEHYLGHLELAQEHLQRANETAAKELAGSPVWNRKLTLELLRQEAEALIPIPLKAPKPELVTTD